MKMCHSLSALVSDFSVIDHRLELSTKIVVTMSFQIDQSRWWRLNDSDTLSSHVSLVDVLLKTVIFPQSLLLTTRQVRIHLLNWMNEWCLFEISREEWPLHSSSSLSSSQSNLASHTSRRHLLVIKLDSIDICKLSTKLTQLWRRVIVGYRRGRR